MTARPTLRRYKRYLHAERCSERIAQVFLLSVLPSFLLVSTTALSQTTAAPKLFETGGLHSSELGLFGTSTKLTSADGSTGRSFSEIMRGNGTPAGYTLTHGNVISATASIHVGGASLKADQDYWLDAANGTLIFARPIRAGDSVSVYYRYLDGAAAAQATKSMPGFRFNLNSSTQLGLTFGTVSGNGSGIDTSIYGLGLNSKFGSGNRGSYGGLVYFSNRRLNSNITSPLHFTSESPSAAPAPQIGTDHLITQNLALQTGGLQFHADYQDIGKNFGGFQALRNSSANDKTALDQLTGLEAEKGVRRMGFGLSAGSNPKSKTPTGLALDWNQIRDDKGSIDSQAIGFNSQNFHMNYASRSVSEKFSLFSGLRESDKTQWSREKGMQTSGLGFGFNFSAGKKTPGALDFSQMRFSDKSGSLERDQFNLNSGRLGLTWFNQKSSKDFKRLNDLSDADRTTIALDIYRQYDPNAKAEQITALDKAAIVKDAGLKRDGLRLDDKFGKTGAFSFSKLSVSEAPKDEKNKTSPGLERENVALTTGALEFNFVRRKTDTGFTRIGDLTDIEKNNLALDIRRQFDPNAKIEQVTQKDRDQLLKETGIERENLSGRWTLGKAGKDGALTFGQLRLSSGKLTGVADSTESGIDRETLAFANKSLQLKWMNQSISSNFAHISDLGDVEKAQFANERGLTHRQFGLNWQINKFSKFSFGALDIGGTDEAVTAFAALARKNNKDVSLAQKAARSGLHRENISLETKGFTFAANSASVDADFAHSADLALPDADRRSIESERGYSRTDYTFHLARTKGLSFDGNIYNSNNALQQLKHDTEKINLDFSPNKSTQLAYSTDSDLTASGGKKNGSHHSLITASQQIGKEYLVNASHDTTSAFDKGIETTAATTDFLHFETAKQRANNLGVDFRKVLYLNGKYENTTNLIVHAKPVSQLTLSYTHQDIDRGIDENQAAKSEDKTAVAALKSEASESTDSVDLQWQATKQFGIVFGVSQRDTTDKKDGDTVSVGLTGQPFKNFTMGAKFNEVHLDGKNTKDVADFSISNTKPICLGLIHELSIVARYASLNDQRKLQNETMTGRASWKIFKNEFLLDYSGLTLPTGESTTYRVYSFITDPNPKKWFHGSFYYKDRTLANHEEKLIRRFTADARLSKRTNFVYMFGTLPEDDKGVIKPLTSADVSLKHQLRSDLSTQFFYRLSSNSQTKVLTRSLGFGFEGKLDKQTRLEFAYSIDANGLADSYDHSNHYHFLFDRKLSGDNFLTLSTEIRSHDSKNLQDVIQANIDFHKAF